MIGIVVVSHSSALAAAALELASQMLQGDAPMVALAAGTDDGGLGTDAVRVAAAIDEVAAASPDGVLVLMDLGSAVLSTEMALEFRESDVPVRLTSAPLVEGLVAALVTAAAGASLDAVAAEAEGALAPKRGHLGAGGGAEPRSEAGARSGGEARSEGEARSGGEARSRDEARSEGEARSNDGGGSGPASGADAVTDEGTRASAHPTPGSAAAAGARVVASAAAGVVAGTGAAASPVEGGVPQASARIVLVNAAGLHARPAASLATALSRFGARVALRNLRTGNVVADAASMSALLTLDARRGDELDVTATGTDASAAVAELESLAADGFGEGAAPPPSARAEVVEKGPSGSETPVSAHLGAAPSGAMAHREVVEKGPSGSETPVSAHLGAADPAGIGAELRAMGVSPGVAVGAVVRMAPAAAEPVVGAPLPRSERAAAAASVGAAFDAVRDGLERRAARLSEARFVDARAVLEATAALASDRALAGEAASRVSEAGLSPARAVWEALDAFATQLTAQGGMLAERAADVRDLRGRVIARLAGAPEPGLPDRAEPFVLVADELAPADAALLGTTPCVGVVMATGGPTSHAAIIVRSLGVPAVISPRARQLVDGRTILLDGLSGELVESPSEERVAQASAHAIAPPFDGTGRTADRHHVELLVNVGAAGEAEQGAELRAEGVGLFRTELAFLDRATAPTVAEQAEIYRPVFEAFPGRAVVVRTLDAGSDKPLAFLPQPAEPNPALGVRGIRSARGSRAVLDTQLAAIARAARAESAEVSVMAPMIATVDEARMFAAAARDQGLGRVGVMIETPAAAVTAAELFAVLDFVSIGTNDLAQYTLAADRELAALAELNDPWQPALLRLIRLVGAAGATAGKPVGICGEAAADPSLAPVLVGLGATSLSMMPNALAAVAASLGAVTHAQCCAAADAAAAATSPAGARAAAAAALA